MTEEETISLDEEQSLTINLLVENFYSDGGTDRVSLLKDMVKVFKGNFEQAMVFVEQLKEPEMDLEAEKEKKAEARAAKKLNMLNWGASCTPKTNSYQEAILTQMKSHKKTNMDDVVNHLEGVMGRKTMSRVTLEAIILNERPVKLVDLLETPGKKVIKIENFAQILVALGNLQKVSKIVFPMRGEELEEYHQLLLAFNSENPQLPLEQMVELDSTLRQNAIEYRHSYRVGDRTHPNVSNELMVCVAKHKYELLESKLTFSNKRDKQKEHPKDSCGPNPRKFKETESHSPLKYTYSPAGGFCYRFHEEDPRKCAQEPCGFSHSCPNEKCNEAVHSLHSCVTSGKSSLEEFGRKEGLRANGTSKRASNDSGPRRGGYRRRLY
jgi:hypothetical protein